MAIFSLDQAKDYIYSIDFSNIINKMVKHGGWHEKDVKRICHLYRNFLFLNAKYNQTHGQLPPSEEIDEFWHNHILDTEKYASDCLMIFGKYFHHYPYFGIDGKTDMQNLYDAFETTQRLHFIEFGDYIYNVRDKLLKQISMFIKYTIAKLKSKISLTKKNQLTQTI